MTDEEIQLAAERHFGITKFRPGQITAIKSALTQKDTLVIMPTGSGKSLCYQLPAVILPGTTLVISPLIALMKDQVDSLLARHIKATYINSSVGPSDMRERLYDMERGEYKLIYIAPERFRNEQFLATLKRTNISLLVIDEAHCISQWGHDFRPDYLNLKAAANLFPKINIMAVTATATPDVRRDIIKQLGLGEAPRKAPTKIIRGFARPNLDINITTCRTHDEKLKHVLNAVLKWKTGIIYVATRKHAETVFQKLNLALLSNFQLNGASTPILYHGAMSDIARTQAHEQFISCAHPVVVATNAFGMGVDRADLRFVIHWDIPGSIEAYYQEIGRAGRDRDRAWCELLFSYADVHTQEYLIKAPNEKEGADPKQIKIAQETRFKKLNEIVNYVQSRTCHHKYILDYFGDDSEKQECGGCDICHSKFNAPPLSEQQWTIIQKILSCVYRMHGRYGPRRVIQVLRGDDDPILEEKGLTTLSTYGILQTTNTRLISNLIDALVESECLTRTDDVYHILAITTKGMQVAKRHFRGFTIPWPKT